VVFVVWGKPIRGQVVQSFLRLIKKIPLTSRNHAAALTPGIPRTLRHIRKRNSLKLRTLTIHLLLPSDNHLTFILLGMRAVAALGDVLFIPFLYV
jgi:hypothetical protein